VTCDSLCDNCSRYRLGRVDPTGVIGGGGAPPLRGSAVIALWAVTFPVREPRRRAAGAKGPGPRSASRGSSRSALRPEHSFTPVRAGAGADHRWTHPCPGTFPPAAPTSRDPRPLEDLPLADHPPRPDGSQPRSPDRPPPRTGLPAPGVEGGVGGVVDDELMAHRPVPRRPTARRRSRPRAALRRPARPGVQGAVRALLPHRHRHPHHRTGPAPPRPPPGPRHTHPRRGLPRPHPHLRPTGSCTVHPHRPMICRLRGLAASMPCPHGCTPTSGHPTDTDTLRRLLTSLETGGHPTPAPATSSSTAWPTPTPPPSRQPSSAKTPPPPQPPTCDERNHRPRGADTPPPRRPTPFTAAADRAPITAQPHNPPRAATPRPAPPPPPTGPGSDPPQRPHTNAAPGPGHRPRAANR